MEGATRSLTAAEREALIGLIKKLGRGAEAQLAKRQQLITVITMLALPAELSTQVGSLATGESHESLQQW